MTHDELKAAHADGAWIFGIEHDGRLHRIENPEWACPADRYLAVVPYVAEPTKAEWDARMVLTMLDVAGFIAPGKLEQAVAIVEDLPPPQPATPTAAADFDALIQAEVDSWAGAKSGDRETAQMFASCLRARVEDAARHQEAGRE